MADGRRLIWRKSAGLTPATVRPTDSAKNAMPNDMAKRGWRTVAQIGSRYAKNDACTLSSRETLGWGARTVTRRRWVSTPVVDARMLLTRLAGGSTSVRPFSQLRPASASANSGPHALHTRAWAWKRSSPVPVRTPSMASASRSSNSLHCIPLLVWSGITSPAYRYVVGAWQVPPALYLFAISRYPPEPSKRWQFHGSPYLVSPLESLLPEVLAKAWPRLRGRSPRPPGCVRGRPGGRIGLESARSGAGRPHGRTPRCPSSQSSGP